MYFEIERKGASMSFFFSNVAERKSAEQKVPDDSSVSGSVRNYHTANMIRGLVSGQTISGEIVGMDGKNVQLALGGDAVITARLDQNINLALGQILQFTVKSSQDNQLLLQPLFTNMGDQETLLKALDAAKLPLSENTIKMVESLMKEGMPIDRQSLHSVYQQIMSNPDTAVEFIVQMNRLQIPVTSENIGQFEAYKNYEHRLIDGMNSVVQELPQSLKELLAGEGGGLDGVRQLLEAFAPEKGKTLQQPVQNPAGETVGIGPEPGGQMAGIAPGKDAPGQSISAEQAKLGIAAGQILSDAAAVWAEDIPAEARGMENTVKILLTPEQREALGALMEQAGMSEKQSDLVRSGELPVRQLIDMTAGLLRQGLAKNGELEQLLTSKPFADILKAAVLEQWTIKPGEIPRERSVEELYERLRQQTARIEEIFSGSLKESSGVMKSVTAIRDNLNFMNHMNQLAAYIQLPLKLSNRNAHGDLYVYTNKRSLAQKDGNVSALLHLDMENLGTVDVHVTMQQERVKTRFYLEKEEYLDFLETHLPLLNERLMKRGYSVQSEAQVREQPVNVLDEMLHQDGGASVIASYAFDVRA